MSAELLPVFDLQTNQPDALRGLHDGRLLTSPAPLDEQALELGIRIPLLIAPLEPRRANYSPRRDGHHGAGFPNDHPDLALKEPSDDLMDELRVVRWSRIQETLRVLHTSYHAKYDHTPLPQNIHESFMAALLHSARYVPPHAVDVRGRRAKIVKVDEQQLEHFHQPGVIHQQEQTQWKIGYFFGKYIMKYGLDAVRDTVEAAQFLAADEAQRKCLGFAVMRLAAETVVDPLEKTYQSARNRRLISPMMPPRALRFVMKHFNQRQPDYFDSLYDQLVAA